MSKPNAYVIISGNLLENEDALDWLRKLVKEYHVSVCIGGGEQINQAFQERGWENKFGPMGRICETLEQRQVCEKVLKENQAIIQDLFNEKGITAEVKIPFGYDGDVLSPVNNDHMISRVYNGHDRIFRLTTIEKKAKKEAFFKEFSRVCQEIGKGTLDKLEILGF
jgi:acetylglutamate kinase